MAERLQRRCTGVGDVKSASALATLLDCCRQFEQGVLSKHRNNEGQLDEWLRAEAKQFTDTLVNSITKIDALLPPYLALDPPPASLHHDVARRLEKLRNQLFAFMKEYGGYFNPEIPLRRPFTDFENLVTVEKTVTCPGLRQGQVVEVLQPCYQRRRGDKDEPPVRLARIVVSG
jgi:hypothetical protein